MLREREESEACSFSWVSSMDILQELAEQGKFEQLNPKFQLLYDEVNKEIIQNA